MKRISHFEAHGYLRQWFWDVAACEWSEKSGGWVISMIRDRRTGEIVVVSNDSTPL
ncbi:MAG: hypothetical protein ACYDCK_01050 [Thermoplasmatota archaeon]